MSQAEELPVEPRLFLKLETYADALSRGDVDPEAELASEIVTFCVNFFQQFLQGFLAWKLLASMTGRREPRSNGGLSLDRSCVPVPRQG
jgi:hypothetical protein